MRSNKPSAFKNRGYTKTYLKNYFKGKVLQAPKPLHITGGYDRPFHSTYGTSQGTILGTYPPKQYENSFRVNFREKNYHDEFKRKISAFARLRNFFRNTLRAQEKYREEKENSLLNTVLDWYNYEYVK